MIKSKPGCASLWSPSMGTIVWVCIAVCHCASPCVVVRHCDWEICQRNEVVEVWEMKNFSCRSFWKCGRWRKIKNLAFGNEESILDCVILLGMKKISRCQKTLYIYFHNDGNHRMQGLYYSLSYIFIYQTLVEILRSDRFILAFNHQWKTGKKKRLALTTSYLSIGKEAWAQLKDVVEN